MADALQTEFLGVALAFDIDLRKLGLLYYVGASSETLGNALRRLARYSTIQNEGVRITYREADAILIAFEYVGVARWSDRHQIEFFVTILLRACRQITGSKLSPRAVKLVHRRTALPARFASLLGGGVEFGSKVDRIELALPAREMPLVNADPFLNSLLLKYCDQALADRDAAGRWRTAVENAIVLAAAAWASRHVGEWREGSGWAGRRWRAGLPPKAALFPVSWMSCDPGLPAAICASAICRSPRLRGCSAIRRPARSIMPSDAGPARRRSRSARLPAGRMTGAFRARLGEGEVAKQYG